jgi:hypothetical protein
LSRLGCITSFYVHADFEKSLFASMLGQYYDIAEKNNEILQELDILLFELKYLKKEDISDKTIAEKLDEAVKQVREYGSAKEFSGKKMTCWAIVFAGEVC